MPHKNEHEPLRATHQTFHFRTATKQQNKQQNKTLPDSPLFKIKLSALLAPLTKLA